MLGESVNTLTTYGFDPATGMQEPKATLCQIIAARVKGTSMARMKFLCDADRCIDCNACVTACKNENEVPWGINRRRVVTINDGKPGERSVSMACMHCTDPPCAAVCPVSCIFPTEEGVVLHSKDLCIGCGYCFYACPFGAPQYPKVGNFGSRGKMDKCTFCAGGGGPEVTGSIEEYRKYGANRLAQGKLPLCAEMCSTKSLLAGDGDDHRPDLRGSGRQARLWIRGLGLDDRLSRGLCEWRGAAYVVLVMFAWMAVVARRVVVAACGTQPNGCRGRSGWKRREGAGAAQQEPRIQGRIDIPDARASVLIQPAGRQWDYFHEVMLHWGGAIVLLGTSRCWRWAICHGADCGFLPGASGKKSVRFTPFERFSHWLTAVSFVLLGLTGLNITFGKLVLLPVIRPESFSALRAILPSTCITS